MTAFNLTEVEKKAYRSTFQDGLWDIFLGSLLLVLSFSALLSNIGAAEKLQIGILIVLQVTLVLAFIIGKKHITIPRLGFVKFGPARKRRITKSRIVLLVSVFTGFIVFLIASLIIQGNQVDRPKLLLFAPAAWVANSIIVFSLLAYYLNFARLYIYGVLFALPVPLDVMIKQFTGLNLSPIAFAVPGLTMLAVGTVLLVRFLHVYPAGIKEVCNDNTN
jgi:hypothetical protein